MGCSGLCLCGSADVAADRMATKAAETKAREAHLRKTLRNSGYSLKKTPARHKSRELHGVGYMVIEDSRNLCVLGSTHWPYDASLDEVEEFAKREG